MRPVADARAFLRAPAARRRLAIEAVGELIRARIDTALPAAHYTRRLGRLGTRAMPAGPGDEALAAEIGSIVAAAARAMPFRARCLQQALAVRRMLSRRGVPATVYLGVARSGTADAIGAAHAWVEAGGRVVSGDTDLDRFAVVGVFA